MIGSKPGAIGAVVVAFLAALAASTPALAAESPDRVWRDVREHEIPRSERARQIVPQRFRAIGLDRARLAALLARAPEERAQRPHESPLVLDLPLPDGSFGTFRVVASPVMEPALAAKYPQIRTYLGQGVDDPTATVRLDVTPKGFHAQIIGAGGTSYVDPYQPGDVDHYIAYRKHDHTAGVRGICEVTGEPIDEERAKDALAKRMHAKLSSGANLRTYRLAMAATGEYTQFHGGAVVDALAAIVTTMNRVNGLYEREVSVRMVLVASNDLIVFTDPSSDPYANTSGDLDENQSTIDSVIGSANYDIGHLVGTGGGGIASLRSPCNATRKAQGLTGSGAPVGDAFDVDYVAHEMGHQFGGNHTFNGSGVNCSGANRSATTAYEPGSGITIQAYAGICGLDNLQPNSEDYFHRVSLDEILAFTTTGTGASCGTAESTGNGIPAVTTTAAFTIPSATPFALTASGSDPDGDALTYVWEQFDLGAAPNTEGVLNPASPNGPLFRSFTPTTSPTRIFPSLRYILDDANVVPATAPAPGTTSPEYFTGEALPTAGRTLNFRVTVRDNRAGGGGTNEATTQLTVVALPIPFSVTAPNTAVSLAAGAATTVTWNFLGTQVPPIGTANVRISLSTDGGHTFPHELAASTANDGSESVTLPAGIATTQARVRIEAVGNVYFDISDADFAITSGNTAPAIDVTGSVTTRQGSPTASGVVATISDAEDSASALSVSVSGAPSELAVSVQNVGGDVTLSATADCSLVAPTSGTKAYPVRLDVTDSAGGTRSAEINVLVGSNRTPTLGDYATLNATQGQARLATPSSAAADANSNLSGASVTPATLPGGGTVSIANDGTVSVVTGAATPDGKYTIRPQVSDTCGATEGTQFDVVVAAPFVSLAIDAVEVTTGNALLEPNECNDVLVHVRNDGNVAATGVSAAVSTATANVALTQATSGYPDIPPGESRANSSPYVLTSTNALSCFSNVGLDVDVTYAGGAGSPFAGSADLPVGRAQALNYAFTAGAGTLPPTDQMTLLADSQQDDGLADLVVPAGFSFAIYDTTVAGGTTLRASSNGNLQFRNNQGATDFANAPLPADGAGNGQAVFPATGATLFLQWDDWRLDVADPVNVAPDAGIYTRLEGTAPNRSWIIEWRGRVRGDGAVAVNNNRAAIVFHEGSNSFDYIYELPGVGAAANAAGSTIGVQAAATGTRFTQYAFNDANLAPGTKLTATIAPAVCAAGNGSCGAPRGVTVTPSSGSTAVAEGGATDTYSIVLEAAPTGDVTIAVAPDAQLSTSGDLVFTTANWNVAQAVTVTAVDDAVAEGAHAGTIAHAASGGGYDGVAVADVTATIADDDTAGVVVAESGGTTAVTEGGAGDSYTLVLASQPTGTVTITVTPNAQLSVSAPTVAFDASDWSTPKIVTVAAIDDAAVEGAHAGTITHAASGGGYDGVAIAAVTASIADDDSAGETPVDVAVTSQLTNAPALAGKRLAYEVAVENLTAGVDATGAQFTFTLSPFLANVSWICVADAGASCPANGNGAPSHAITLQGGTGVSYAISADVPVDTAEGTAIDTLATVEVTAPSDSAPDNNDAATSHTVGTDAIFRDGFEDPIASARAALGLD